MKRGASNFESMAAAARRETAPVGDVSNRTLAAIGALENARSAARPMLVFAGAYAFLCVAAIAAGYLYLGMEADSMGSFFAMASEVSP